MKLAKKIQFDKLNVRPAVVAWIVRELFSHSIEEYVLAIRRSNPAWTLYKYVTENTAINIDY